MLHLNEVLQILVCGSLVQHITFFGLQYFLKQMSTFFYTSISNEAPFALQTLHRRNSKDIVITKRIQINLLIDIFMCIYIQEKYFSVGSVELDPKIHLLEKMHYVVKSHFLKEYLANTFCLVYIFCLKVFSCYLIKCF